MNLRDQVVLLLPDWERWYPSLFDAASDLGLIRAEVCDFKIFPDLDKLLAVLTEDERAIIVMSYACGLSHREISDVTGLPTGTVKSVIYRSKEKIRKNFEIKDHQHG